MKLLLHPLAMPIYTFALYLEIERQSYVVNYIAALVAEGMLLLLMLLSDRMLQTQKKSGSPLVNVQSAAGARVAMAVSNTIVFVTITFIIKRMGLYTWGSPYILLIYIVPSWLNIISGAAAAQISGRLASSFAAKSNAAPSAFIGALSGFTIMIGYKTGTDTFWPFVITLLMFTLSAMFPYNDTETRHSHQIYWYITGAAQAVAIMLLGK